MRSPVVEALEGDGRPTAIRRCGEVGRAGEQQRRSRSHITSKERITRRKMIATKFEEGSCAPHVARHDTRVPGKSRTRSPVKKKPNQIPVLPLLTRFKVAAAHIHKYTTQRRTRNLKKATGDHTASVAPSSKNSTVRKFESRAPVAAAFVRLPAGSSASRSPVHSTAAGAPAARVEIGEEIHPGRGLLFCFFW
jgi:hypothetical protein